ncbi:hypothetical protein B296_00026558 [Ensete ventricosum]|uniref:BHLH domain-containing protein n=1 Tax=Ensete ventricosum TaxID=4639 RepID=A0A426ZRS5_ENSVE|nr:hypothetical protein B296_00026558 [Ensete ventricosum]
MHAIPPLAPCNLQHRHAYMHEEVPTWSMVDTARQPPSYDMHVWLDTMHGTCWMKVACGDASPAFHLHALANCVLLSLSVTHHCLALGLFPIAVEQRISDRRRRELDAKMGRESEQQHGLMPCPPSLVVSLTPLSLLPHSLNRFYFGLRQDVEQEVPSLRGRDQQARFQAPVSPAGDPPTRRRQGKQARALRLLLSNGNSMPSGSNPYVHVPVVQASAAKLLKETCNYIRSLNRDVDDLSDRLSAIMATMDSSSAEAEMVRSLLRP